MDSVLAPDLKLQTAANLYRNKDAIVAAERNSLALWDGFGDLEKAAVMLRIRETLLRLLEDPGWVPGSLMRTIGTVRLDVTFSVDLVDIEDVMDRLLTQQSGDLQEKFLGLLKELQDGTAEDGRGQTGARRH